MEKLDKQQFKIPTLEKYGTDLTQMAEEVIPNIFSISFKVLESV